jgi:hypothetical protein
MLRIKPIELAKRMGSLLLEKNSSSRKYSERIRITMHTRNGIVNLFVIRWYGKLVREPGFDFFGLGLLSVTVSFFGCDPEGVYALVSWILVSGVFGYCLYEFNIPYRPARLHLGRKGHFFDENRKIKDRYRRLSRLFKEVR